METLYQVLGLIGAGLIVWVIYRTVKGKPDAFTPEVMGKSFRSMGVLALLLIVFVAFLVMLLRSGV